MDKNKVNELKGTAELKQVCVSYIITEDSGKKYSVRINLSLKEDINLEDHYDSVDELLSAVSSRNITVKEIKQ